MATQEEVDALDPLSKSPLPLPETDEAKGIVHEVLPPEPPNIFASRPPNPSATTTDTNVPLTDEDQARAAREAMEQQAEARRSHAITAIQRSEGIGMEQPDYKATGPLAFEAEQELAQIRAKSPVYRAQPWQALPNFYERGAVYRAGSLRNFALFSSEQK